MSFNRSSSSTNTGLGDDQYAQLQTNQGLLGAQAEQGFLGASTKLDNISSGVTNLGTNINTGMDAGFTNIQSLLDTYNTGMNDQFSGVSAQVGNNATALATNNQALGNLQTDVSGGFNEQGQRFNTLDTNVSNVQGAVDQGFVNQDQSFADAQADRTTRFNATDAALATGFQDTGAALNTGFGDASTQLADTQSSVLANQNQLQTDLNTMSSTADAYADQSLANQASLQSGQDGFVSSFDNYVERYGEDEELAQTARTDLATAQANQTDRLREDMGKFAQAAATQVDNVAQGVDSRLNTLGDTVEGGFVAAQADAQAAAQRAASLESEFAQGLAGLDAGQITQTRDLAKIASSQTDLDMGMRQEFNQLGNAFDDSGKLIESTIDAQGNTIARAMDEQGNLILNSFDSSGQGLGSKTVNIRTVLQNLNNLQTRPGANAAMGNLTPASSSAVPNSGFASPFARTG